MCICETPLCMFNFHLTTLMSSARLSNDVKFAVFFTCISNFSYILYFLHIKAFSVKIESLRHIMSKKTTCHFNIFKIYDSILHPTMILDSITVVSCLYFIARLSKCGTPQKSLQTLQ